MNYPLLCRIGFHRWQHWVLLNGARQYRRCLLCGYVEVEHL